MVKSDSIVSRAFRVGVSFVLETEASASPPLFRFLFHFLPILLPSSGESDGGDGIGGGVDSEVVGVGEDSVGESKSEYDTRRPVWKCWLISSWVNSGSLCNLRASSVSSIGVLSQILVPLFGSGAT
ncbi:hypothetical protein M5689_006865 [Euphorbia peplus]|nr:hypothetical protein M5689_006865 [Euphorbia peplus]